VKVGFNGPEPTLFLDLIKQDASRQQRQYRHRGAAFSQPGKEFMVKFAMRDVLVWPISSNGNAKYRPCFRGNLYRPAMPGGLSWE
jgi:hypothetical protein